jgi:hypothetical protein
MPTIVEQFHEFAARHGKYVTGDLSASPRTADAVAQHYFEDGSHSDGTTHTEPPSDIHALRQAQRRYLALTLAIEERQWRQYKDWCMAQAANARRFPSACPAPSANCVEDLRAGKERINTLREKLRQLDELIASTNPVKQTETKRDQLARAQQEQASALMADLTRIQLDSGD